MLEEEKVKTPYLVQIIQAGRMTAKDWAVRDSRIENYSAISEVYTWCRQNNKMLTTKEGNKIFVDASK